MMEEVVSSKIHPKWNHMNEILWNIDGLYMDYINGDYQKGAYVNEIGMDYKWDTTDITHNQRDKKGMSQ